MNMMKKLWALACALALCLSLWGCSGQQTQPQAQPEDPMAAAAAWLLDTVEAPGYGSVGGEWMILGLARSGLEVPEGWFEDYYQALCAYTAENGGVLDARKYTEYSRVILALTALGKDPSDVAGFDLLKPLADFDQAVFQGVNGPVFALLALDCGGYEIPEKEGFSTQATRELYVEYILNAQLPGGGWSFSGGDAEADMTAMALQALAKYRDRQDVSDAVERGLEALSGLQSSSGGFGEDGTCESVAQAIVALTELGMGLEEERFVKNGNTLEDALLGFRNADGGFRHLAEGESDLLATEQAFYALVAIDRMEQGKTSLYSMK